MNTFSATTNYDGGFAVSEPAAAAFTGSTIRIKDSGMLNFNHN